MAIAAPIMAVAAVAGAALSAASVVAQARAQSMAASYNSQAAERNAVLSKEQAGEDERQFRVFARKQLGDIRASYGASGVSLEGSPMDILAEGAAAAELDALRIRHGGEIKALGYQSDATLSKFASEATMKGGYLSAAGTLLKSGSNIYSSYGPAGGGGSTQGSYSGGSAGGSYFDVGGYA